MLRSGAEIRRDCPTARAKKNYALLSRRKNGYYLLMREALTKTVSNRNKVDDDWSMQECLSRFLETEALKSEQSEALGSLISRREVIVILPTGFGKSLFFFFHTSSVLRLPSSARNCS